MKERFGQIRNFSFGGTSAIITNISLIVGLGAGDAPKSAIIGGILVIAVADNISDSLGIHIYKESESGDTREPFISTALNFITRFVISVSFIFLVLLLPIRQAQVVSMLWGLLLLSVMSYFIARRNKQNPVMEQVKHIGVAILVIAASRIAGELIRRWF